MSKIKMVVSIFFAALVVAGVVAPSSYARLLVLVDGNPPASKPAYDERATLFTMTDMKGGIFGEEVTISCSNVTDEGVLLSTTTGEVTSSVASECVTTKGTCESKPKVTALNLPWDTETAETGENMLIGSGAGGEPGWEVMCALGVNDSCTGMSLPNVAGLPKNGTKNADLDLTFTLEAAEAHPATCSRGGANQGLFLWGKLMLVPGKDLTVDVN